MTSGMGRLVLDLSSKILLLVAVAVLIYSVTLALLAPLFASPQLGGRTMIEMMAQMMSRSSGNALLLNVAALLPALVVALGLSLIIETTPRRAEVDEYRILKGALSDDENRVVDEIRRAEVITQDSLVVRLDWSKSKVSRILTNLDRMNIIQRERSGKTYRVFLAGPSVE